jgi:hypothetical protein
MWTALHDNRTPYTARVEPVPGGGPDRGGFPAVAVSNRYDRGVMDHTSNGGRVFRRSLMAEPPVAVESSGATITDSTGKTYIDAAGGAIVVNVGHGRASIADAMADQVGDWPMPTGRRSRPSRSRRMPRRRRSPAPRRRRRSTRVGRLGGDRDRPQAARHLPPVSRRARPDVLISR